MEYFGDKERVGKPRTEESISPDVWGGIVAIVDSLVLTGAFGGHFPKVCPDGAGPVGTDEQTLARALKAEIPDLEWPLRTVSREQEGFFCVEVSWAPPPLVVLDLVQFCYWHSAKPIQGRYHSFFQHHHLSFDSDAGKDELRAKINRIFARNGVAYELTPEGGIARLAPPGLREELNSSHFITGDETLDNMLNEARNKFLNPNPAIRREAVERLWDAWERLKSIADPANKKVSTAQMLDAASMEPNFRAMLEREAQTLNEIGNSFQIRHTEVTQTAIQRSEQIDYLFHRLLAIILLLLHRTR